MKTSLLANSGIFTILSINMHSPWQINEMNKQFKSGSNASSPNESLYGHHHIIFVKIWFPAIMSHLLFSISSGRWKPGPGTGTADLHTVRSIWTPWTPKLGPAGVRWSRLWDGKTNSWKHWLQLKTKHLSSSPAPIIVVVVGSCVMLHHTLLITPWAW